MKSCPEDKKIHELLNDHVAQAGFSAHLKDRDWLNTWYSSSVFGHTEVLKGLCQGLNFCLKDIDKLQRRQSVIMISGVLLCVSWCNYKTDLMFPPPW